LSLVFIRHISENLLNSQNVKKNDKRDKSTAILILSTVQFYINNVTGCIKYPILRFSIIYAKHLVCKYIFVNMKTI